MKRPFPYPAVGVAAFILLMIAGAVILEINVWNECRSTNSFWYCMRVLSK